MSLKKDSKEAVNEILDVIKGFMEIISNIGVNIFKNRKVIFDNIMVVVTIGSMWHKIPWRVHFKSTDYPKKNRIKSIIKALIVSMVLIFSMIIAKNSEAIAIIMLLSLVFIIWQLFLIAYSKISEDSYKAFINGEYPFLWISTLLSIAVSLATNAFGAIAIFAIIQGLYNYNVSHLLTSIILFIVTPFIYAGAGWFLNIIRYKEI